MCILTQQRMNGALSKSAVVRARHLPDVNGVNRYKYFHRPLIPDELVGVVCSGSIDSKKASQRAEQLLPPIRPNPNVIRATSVVDVEKNSALTANKPSNVSTKKKDRNGGVDSPASKVRQSNTKEPQELSVTNLNAVSSSSTLPPISSKKGVKPTKRLNATWPSKDETVSNGRIYGARNSSNGARAESGSTKRSQSVSSVRTTDVAFLGRTTSRPNSSWNHVHKVPIKDFGTQTDTSGAQLAAFSTPTIVVPESMQVDENKHNTPKATQTNNLAVLTRLSISERVDDIEQRSKLLEIVDEALDQTIDKNSRQRVNELIASSARKQVEVWRDAKDFVSSVLLPQSVAIANRARRPSRSPLEAIANTHFP